LLAVDGLDGGGVLAALTVKHHHRVAGAHAQCFAEVAAANRVEDNAAGSRQRL